MQFSVENKRQILLRIVFGSQVAFFFRAVRRDAIARVVDPAHDVIEVGFFADALEVGGKVTAHRAVAFADRVAGKTTAGFEQFFAVTGVSALLRWQSVESKLSCHR